MMLLSEARVRELAGRFGHGAGLEGAVGLARRVLAEGAVVGRRLAALGSCPGHLRPFSPDCAFLGCPGARPALTSAREEAARRG